MAIHWPRPAGLHTSADRLPVEGELPSFDGATGWLNSPPLTPAALRGKAVLVNFWTYTCINWLRQLPYLRAWAAKYSGHGLVVIGVHTPEFAFEHDPDNVRRASADMGIDVPGRDRQRLRGLATPSTTTTGRPCTSPTRRGRIRHHHFGEGEYQQSEMVIQQLLAEAGSPAPATGLVRSTPAAWKHQPTGPPWISGKLHRLRPHRELRLARGRPCRASRHLYTAPAELRLNHWALSGDWTIGEQAATLNAAGGQIAYRFHARDLNLVMGPAAPGTAVRFRVLIDGQAPGAAHGADADEQGSGTLAEQRLHQLIRQPGPITDRTFEITFLDPGAQAFSFTFG